MAPELWWARIFILGRGIFGEENLEGQDIVPGPQIPISQLWFKIENLEKSGIYICLRGLNFDKIKAFYSGSLYYTILSKSENEKLISHISFNQLNEIWTQWFKWNSSHFQSNILNLDRTFKSISFIVDWPTEVR